MGEVGDRGTACAPRASWHTLTFGLAHEGEAELTEWDVTVERRIAED
jgi:hypothetical protein